MPLVGRIAIWGTVAGILAMAIYRLASDQAAIRALKEETRILRRKMLDPSLETRKEFAILARQNLRASLGLLRKVLLPAFLSVLPVALIMLWLNTYHGYAIPKDASLLPVTIVPAGTNVDIYPAGLVQESAQGILVIPPKDRSEEISFFADGQIIYSGALFSAPVPVISKKKWWNLVLGNRAGYITSSSSIEEIHFAFPRNRLFEGFPSWVAGWELTFFLSAMFSGLVVKYFYGIH